MSRSLALTLLLTSVLPVAAADPPAGARLHNLKVLSDRVDDVTTAENILSSFAKPGMSDAERARAIWTAAVRYRHQAPPPREYLSGDWEAHDPVKLFNVYGYCQCCCSSAVIEALNRLDGREARGRILTGHSVPEVRYDGGWHMFDASLVTYFPRPGDGAAAGVDEIAADVRAWHDRNPGFRKDAKKLTEYMRRDGRTGWKQGPGLLAACPFFKEGWFPAGTHGWYSAMIEYDRQSEVYEYGYHVGHRALFSLRPGESLVREAGNRGLHVNQDRDRDRRDLKARAPRGDLKYLKEFLPGYNGGVVANGYHRYAPDIARGGLAGGADVYDNLAVGADGVLRPAATGQPGVVVIPMTSPYVYLGGRITLTTDRRADADRVTVAVSTNNGRTFTPVWEAPVGRHTETIDLSARVLRRYAFCLRVELTAATTGGAGLAALSVENDIQHAPRTLPWLGKGANTVTVAADRDTSIASQAITGRITPDPTFDNNEATASLGVTFDNLDVRDDSCWWTSGVGTMTVPVETPGDLAALRVCVQARARGEKDLIRALVSCDGGKTWREAGRLAGPTPGHTATFRFAEFPHGVRSALLRFELTGTNTVGIFSWRADADYLDPKAAAAGRPFDVVYRWKEDGQEKVRRERVARLPHRFSIATAAEPDMVSVTCSMPASDKGEAP
jgi:hypothetical protein